MGLRSLVRRYFSKDTTTEYAIEEVFSMLKSLAGYLGFTDSVETSETIDLSTVGRYTSYVFIRSWDEPSNPEGNTPVGWSDGPPDVTADRAPLWMSQATFVGGSLSGAWSNPVRMSGSDGIMISLSAPYGTVFKREALDDPPTPSILSLVASVWYGDLDVTNDENITFTWTGATTPSTTKTQVIPPDDVNESLMVKCTASWRGFTASVSQTLVDVTDGAGGSDGAPIVWKGELSSAPGSPQVNWVYRNLTDGIVYIFNGSAWVVMVSDGDPGADGDPFAVDGQGLLSARPSTATEGDTYYATDTGLLYFWISGAWDNGVPFGKGDKGDAGLSVFLTYHSNPLTSMPARPTGEGTSNGWHTDAVPGDVWFSQKIASAAGDGLWGVPISMTGEALTVAISGNSFTFKYGADGTSITPSVIQLEAEVYFGSVKVIPDSIVWEKRTG